MNTAYRVWDGQQMHYWDDEGIRLVFEHDGSWFLWLNGMIAHSGDGNSVLMWGTGLKDKHDGDIFHKDFFEFANGDKGIVEWIEDEAMFNVPQYYDPGADYPNIAFGEHAHCFGKVTGNVFENPELLEGAE
ncbi:YopX family protein [Bacillus atrophaeus]|uniref:YopX family protein n=1 Tax=Bacillus atrophaeus TaxID=1452 RepID=UPI002E0571B3|nr:YopX family protein [Bacillus atrophaeus]